MEDWTLSSKKNNKNEWEKKKSFNIILQGRCIFYKVEEEREKGRHVDVKVLAKRAIAPVVSLGHLELRTFTKSGL